MARKIHTNIRELGIPSLTTFVHRLANGVARSMVTTTVHMWDTQKKRSKVIARETVGRIENGEPFGRIAFKEAFLERYPILRQVTVMRLNSYEYGYIKAPLPKTLTYESLTLKRGPKFKSEEAEKAAAARKARLAKRPAPAVSTAKTASKTVLKTRTTLVKATKTTTKTAAAKAAPVQAIVSAPVEGEAKPQGTARTGRCPRKAKQA